MNERIKELAEQADIKESLVVQFKGDRRAYVVQYNELEKFAELIVRECVSVAMEQYDDTLPWGGVEDVLKQFGVEE